MNEQTSFLGTFLKHIFSINELGTAWAYQHFENVYQQIHDKKIVAVAEGGYTLEFKFWSSLCDELYYHEKSIDVAETKVLDTDRRRFMSPSFKLWYNQWYSI